MPTTTTNLTSPTNKGIKQIPSSVTIRSNNNTDVKISDEKMYGSNQTTFLTETEKHIKQVHKFLSTDSFEFDHFLDEIGSCRNELARTQKESSMYEMGKRRNSRLHTLISQPYYADRTLELYKNLEQTAASSSHILQTFDVSQNIATNPYLHGNTYKKYQIKYHTHDNQELPLTRCYVASGNYLPASPKDGVSFPDPACELSPANDSFTGHNSGFEEFIKCTRIEDILKHDEYYRPFNKSELLNIAESYPKLGTADLSREAFAATYGKLIRGGQGSGSIANKDSWCCIKNPDKTEQAMGIGLCHPQPEDMKKTLDEAKYEFSQYKETKKTDKNKAFEHGCNVVYLMAHAAPFNRGSAWSAEVAASAMMRDLFQRDDISFVKSNLDFLAFGKTSTEFTEILKKECSK